jgi:calcium-dependent protein kinase
MLYRQNDLTCIKIIDFGLSKDFSESNTMRTMSGSPYYVAPEVFLQKYNQKIDIWSLGVVLYIMLSGKVPFPGVTEPEIIYNVIKGEFHFNHPAFENISELCKDLIRKCLVKDYNFRCTATEALDHPWFKSNTDFKMTETLPNAVSTEVISGMEEVLRLAADNYKNAALQYFSKKVTPNNFVHLQ